MSGDVYNEPIIEHTSAEKPNPTSSFSDTDSNTLSDSGGLLVTNPSHLLRCALQILAFAGHQNRIEVKSNQTDPLGAMTISIHLSSLFLRLPI